MYKLYYTLAKGYGTGPYPEGSTELDEWYWIDIKRTYEELDEILGQLEDAPDEIVPGRTYPIVSDEPGWRVKFYYHSSW